MTTQDEEIVLEIDPQIIKNASTMLANAIISNEVDFNYGKIIVYESEALTINLDLSSSIVAGLTDPIGQIRAFIRDVLGWLWDKISSAIADVLAKTLAKLGEIAPEIAGKIASAIKIITDAISGAIVTISGAIATGLVQISAGITTLSTSILSLGTAISGTITMVGTSLSTQIASVSTTISQSILNVGASVSTAIFTVASSIAQSILTISTSIAVGISQVITVVSTGIIQLGTAISGSIAMVATSIGYAISTVGASLATTIMNVAGAIANSINIIGASIAKSILDLSLAVSQGIAFISASISQAILSISTAVSYGVVTLATSITASFALLTGRIDYAISLMTDFFPIFVTNLKAGYLEMSSAIREAFQRLSDLLNKVYSETINLIRITMLDFATSINQVIRDFTITVAGNLRIMTDALVSNLQTIVTAITTSARDLSQTMLDIHRDTMDVILTTYKDFSRAINESLLDFSKTVADSIEKVSSAIIDGYNKVIGTVMDTGEKLRNFIAETNDILLDKILANLEETMSKLKEVMLEWEGLLKQIAVTFEGFINSILQLPERLEPTAKKHAMYTWEEYWARFYEQTSPDFKLVYQQLPRLFKEESPSPWDIVLESIKALKIGRTVSISLIPVTVPPNSYLAIPPDAKTYIEQWSKTPLFWSSLGEFFGSLGSVIVGAFQGYVLPALQKFGELLWNGIKTLGDFLVKLLEEFLKSIWEGLKALSESVTQFFIGSSVQIMKDLGLKSPIKISIAHSPEITIISPEDISRLMPTVGFASTLNSIFTDYTMHITLSSSELMKTALMRTHQTASKELKITPPEIIPPNYVESSFMNYTALTFVYASLPLLAQFPARGIAHVLFQIGSALMNKDWKWRFSLRPFGLGIDVEINFAKLIGGSLSHFAKELKEFADIIGAGMTYGLAIWASQPISRMLSFHIRNIIPVELPTLENILEILRRSIPHKEFERMHALSKYFLSLYGYSDIVIKLLTSLEQEYYIIIKDRFNQERRIPLSLMYELPSVSDVARMMVRDIILELESFKNFFKARGMVEDVAVMYYLLHFRYPPPEKLWTFVTRGISGLLWYTPSPDERRLAEEEATKVKAYTPVPISSLNFKGKEIFDAFASYLKWHDYAKFSYLQNFTSDNQIIIDTLADIPTKIDQRWMVRFGLYELLSMKGVQLTDPISAFANKVIEGTATSQIVLDLTNFCRTLQATGLHPYYVPITAVAETINTIADERTLLRTGVLNLYKEGFIDVLAVDKLFTGVIYTSFKVAFYDTETHQWKQGFINVPLRYLNMEAKLMEMRAIIDRALDILKDIQRDVLTAYQEWIIETYDEFKTTFTKVIDSVNQVYALEFKTITGKDLPDELKLKFIEEYYKPYIYALEIWRYVHVYRRIRTWTMRWLGWLLYRVGYGVMKKEEITSIVDYMCKASKLTKIEKEYLYRIMELMSQLAVREYIPTPPQLATLAEYISIPDDVITKVFDARGVPEEFRELWASYIRVRPVADDIKAVITAYRRALLYAPPEKGIPPEIESAVKQAMAKIGFTSEEEFYLHLRVALEELVLNAKEYIPTPTQLASLSEYVPIPKELIIKALQYRKVPQEWAELWIKYIEARPLADDVRGLITTLFRAIEYIEEAKNYVPKVIDLAKSIGFTDREIEIFKLRAMLEELIYKSREYVPTPIQLATVCELMPEARAYFDDMVKRLRISSEWAGLWAKYIDLRPVVDDVKRMMSRAEDLFCYFMITEENFMQILKSVQSLLGYTDKEIEFLLYTTRLRRHQIAWRELVGDVDRMVMLSEYSPTAREYALGTLYKMIDSLNIDAPTKEVLKKMWEDFIRIKPIIDEVKTYIRDLINAYVDGIVSEQAFLEELEALREWGLDDYEIQFYKAIATLRKARKLKITLY